MLMITWDCILLQKGDRDFTVYQIIAKRYLDDNYGNIDNQLLLNIKIW